VHSSLGVNESLVKANWFVSSQYTNDEIETAGAQAAEAEEVRGSDAAAQAANRLNTATKRCAHTHTHIVIYRYI